MAQSPLRNAVAIGPIVALLSFAAAAPAIAQHADATAFVPSLRGVLVVKTRELPSQREPAALPAPRSLALLRSAGLRSVRLPFARGAASLMGADRHGLGRIFEVRYDGAIDPRDLAARLEATGEIEYAEPVPVRMVDAGSPNDSAYAMQYALQLIDAEGAWAVTRGDTSVVVGIVDTGLDWEHEDLAGNIWRNPGEIPGNGVDDDGNGYIDDVRGWDFVGDVSMAEIEQGIYREDNDPKVRAELSEGDIRNHGTHVGGIVAATGDNGRGVAGVAYGCRLMPVKTSSDVGATYIFRGYEAILYCARNGADVVNCSWGGTTSSRVEADVVAEALDLGCVVVAASGNNGYDLDALDFYPALIPGIISAGASDRDDREAYFSNHGVATTVFAPGVDVLSTVAGNGYGPKSGTSMASPVVAGVAALVRSVHPDWTPSMVLSQLRSTSDSALRDSSQNRPAYFGRVNARRAVTMNGAAGSAAVPGVVLAGIRWLDGDDTVRTSDTRRIALTLHNNLATTRRLTVVAAPIDPQLAVVSGAVTIVDSIVRGGDAEIVLDVRIPRQSMWFAGSLALQIGLRDTAGYGDFLIAHLPFELPAPTRYTDITAKLGDVMLDGVDSPSPDVAWIFAETISGQDIVTRIVDGRATSSNVAIGASSHIEALDSLRCTIWSTTTIGTTDDGGATWRYVRADSVTGVGRIDRPLRFSDNESCVLGRTDYATRTIAYAWSGDAGATWRQDTIRFDTLAPVGSLYQSTVRGRTAIVGLGGRGILRSDDAGRTWSVLPIGESLSVAQVGLWSEREGILVATGGGGTRLASTSDGGATWRIAEQPFAAADPRAALLTPLQGETSYLLGRTGALVSVDSSGGSRQIPSRRQRTELTDASASASDTLVRIWHVGAVAGYLDIPLRTSGADLTDSRTGLALASLRPIPAHDALTVTITAEDGATLDVIDLLGRTVMTRTIDRADREQRLTLSIGSLAPGRYLLRARSGVSSVARSFVVE
jgi:subtilisin family serine protease